MSLKDTATLIGGAILNPKQALAMIIGVIVIAIVVLFLAGQILYGIITYLMSPLFWGLALLIVAVVHPSTPSSTIVWGVLMSLPFWLFGIWTQMQGMSPWCSIPFIGPVICGAYAGASLLPWILDLVIKVLASLIQLAILSFIMSVALGGKK